MKSLLVIDDDESVRGLIKIKFGSTYLITEAENGKIGLDLFKRIKPDVVITDIIMPEEEGLKTILEIRKLDKQVPVIAITGMLQMGGLNSLDIAKEFGATIGMHKPIDLKLLKSKMEELLGTTATS